MEGLREIIQADLTRSRLFFAAVLIFLAYLVWLSLYLAFEEILGGTVIWVLAILAILLFAIGIALSFFLLKPEKLAFAAYFIAAFLSILLFGADALKFIAAGIFFLTLVFGYLWIKREQKLLLPFLYSRLLHRGMPIFFTGFALALAALYNTSPIGEEIGVPQLPDELFITLRAPLEYALSPLLQDIPKEDLPLFISELINSRIRDAISPYGQYLPFIYFFGLFLLIRAFGMPLMYLAIGLGWIIVKILLYYKIIKIHKKTVKKEELVL